MSKRAKIAAFLATFDDVKFLGDFTMFCAIGATVLGKVNQFRRGNEIVLHDAIARKRGTYLAGGELTRRGLTYWYWASVTLAISKNGHP